MKHMTRVHGILRAVSCAVSGYAESHDATFGYNQAGALLDFLLDCSFCIIPDTKTVDAN